MNTPIRFINDFIFILRGLSSRFEYPAEQDNCNNVDVMVIATCEDVHDRVQKVIYLIFQPRYYTGGLGVTVAPLTNPGSLIHFFDFPIA